MIVAVEPPLLQLKEYPGVPPPAVAIAEPLFPPLALVPEILTDTAKGSEIVTETEDEVVPSVAVTV